MNSKIEICHFRFLLLTLQLHKSHELESQVAVELSVLSN